MTVRYVSMCWVRGLTGLLLLTAFFPAARGAAVQLVAEGRPTATIVIPADCPAVLEQAAEDLRHYVRAISGATLPVQRDGAAVAGVGLYLGSCEPTMEADLPAADLNPESFAIRVRNGNLFFTGRHPTPASFAVYTFLEDDLGIRWFAPGELWEDVPRGDPGTLSVAVEERVIVPDTSPRIWSGHSWYPRWKDWNRRNKTVPGEIMPRRQFQNRIHSVFPAATYAEAHPEYYPLIDGKRFIPPAGMRYWRPCESNPDVQALTVQYARRWFDTHPDVDSFSLGMDDISHLCSCPSCRAMDPSPTAYEDRQFSDRHYLFVNRIAREVAKTHPERYIGTLIYNVARDLPETVPELEPNVFGFITETSALWWQDGRKEADHDLTREWAKRCDHLSRYDYYGMGCFTPRYYPHAVAEQIKFDKSVGLEGMYIEVYTFLPHTAPMIWLTAKLQWDHTLDPDALLREFRQRMYGPAAGTMQAYWDLLERSWNTPREGRGGWVHRRIEVQALAMSADDVDAAFELLGEALSQCDHENQRRRIRIHRDALRYSSYAIYACDLSRKLDRMTIGSRADAEQAVEHILRLGQLSRERLEFYETVPQRDDLLGLNVRAMTETMSYMPVSDFQKLESGTFRALMRALDWYERNAPEDLPGLVTKVQTSVHGSVGRTLKSYLYVKTNQPDNLLENGGFEAVAGQAQAPAEPDWRVEGAPPGWSVWSRSPAAAFETRRGDGIDGSAAASIAKASGAVYIQNVDVSAGERLLATVRIRKMGSGGEATLSYRFRTPAGAWHPRRDLEGSVKAVPDDGDWQLVAVAVTVPEGAGTVSIMLGAGGQTDDDKAVFDQAALYRIPAE